MLPEALGQRAELSITREAGRGPPQRSSSFSPPKNGAGVGEWEGAELCPVCPQAPMQTPTCQSQTALPSGPTGGQGHIGSSPNTPILFVMGPVKW